MVVFPVPDAADAGVPGREEARALAGRLGAAANWASRNARSASGSVPVAGVVESEETRTGGLTSGVAERSIVNETFAASSAASLVFSFPPVSFFFPPALTLPTAGVVALAGGVCVAGAVAGSGKSAASSSRNACVSSIFDFGFLLWADMVWTWIGVLVRGR